MIKLAKYPTNILNGEQINKKSKFLVLNVINAIEFIQQLHV